MTTNYKIILSNIKDTRGNDVTVSAAPDSSSILIAEAAKGAGFELDAETAKQVVTAITNHLK